ncbi:MAG: hypothetical protein JJ968_12230 [Erythrobacter sp.]|nr:hypothetical protein [Erythrobacter sp.]
MAIAPTGALACMANGPEGYVSGLVWESRHTVVPDDAIALKVEILRPQPEFFMAAVAKVLEGPEDLQGLELTVIPEYPSSCVGMGRRIGHIVVRKAPMEIDGHAGVLVYSALDYLPHISDRSKGFDPESNWFVPGDPAGELSSFPER